jgi:hypothetical protein
MSDKTFESLFIILSFFAFMLGIALFTALMFFSWRAIQFYCQFLIRLL